jgi:YD repeat-containing protein
VRETRPVADSERQQRQSVWENVDNWLMPTVTREYNDAGQLCRLTRFVTDQGVERHTTTEHTFDPVGRIQDRVHTSDLGGGLAAYHYTFNLAGELTSETHHGRSSTYGYDSTGQLRTADHDSQSDEQYDFDANGNRTSAGVVPGPGNRILADANFDYGYDDDGNLISKTERATGEVTTYAYDYRDRLVTVIRRSAGDVILSESHYTYDVFDPPHRHDRQWRNARYRL